MAADNAGILETLGAPIALGRTAEVYAWNDGRVLKLYHTWFSPDSIAHEHRLARAIFAAGVPTPAVFEQIELDGRIGLVYGRVSGEPMVEALAAEPWKTGKLARFLAELQVKMHQAAGVPGLPSQHDQLRRKIQGAEVLPDDLKEDALALLDRLAPSDRLCHGDFHPGNVMMTPDGPVVIDWIDATSGNPLCDVARTLLLMSKSPLPGKSMMRFIVGNVRGWFLRAYRRRCYALQPWNEAELDRWLVVNAAARLEEGVAETPVLLAYVQEELPKHGGKL